MAIFDLSDLRTQQERSDRLYHEFLRVPDLSAGLYVVPDGGTDPQQPHTEDEIYYVIAGRAQFRLGDDTVSVQAGSVIFVPAGAVHRFYGISEELTLLVVFGPAEYTHAASASAPEIRPS
jgi:mannose-6-phosphate isomerase-like protein (cupin superfamily)